jgi:hypothetical protein
VDLSDAVLSERLSGSRGGGVSRERDMLAPQMPPQGTDLSCYTQTEIAAKLNRRPRKTLGFKTPTETLEKALMEAADALTA